MADSFITMAQEAFIVDWVAGACLAILLYDHLITFDNEVDRIWTLRFGIPKVLFFLNRYVVSPMLIFNGIASTMKNPAPEFCVFYLRWLDVTITVTTFVIEGILTLRVLALYKNNKIVSAIALFFYAAGVVTLIGLTIQDYVGESVNIVSDFAELPGCYAASVPGMVAGYWITQVAVESILSVLIFYKTIPYLRGTEHGSAPPTLVLLARDSTIWYFIVFSLLMVNLFVFEFAPPFLSSLMVTPVNTAGCIAGSRLLLNLRGLAVTSSHNATPTAFSGNVGSNDGYRYAFASARRSNKVSKGDIGAKELDTVMSTNDGVWDDMEMSSVSMGGTSPLSPVEIAVERSIILDGSDLESQDESKERLGFPRVSVPQGSPFAL